MDVEQHALRLRSGWISLVAGITVFSGKLAAWQLTGSTAVLSDALESIVNIAAASLLLFSLWIASHPADRSHPYGHGKVEFFSAGIEGTLIAIAAGLIAVEAVRDLIVGPSLQRLDVGAAMLAGFGAVNAALGLYLVRVGRRTRSPALVADGRHVLTDVWTTGGVLIGLGLVALTGWATLDPLVALAVAAQILREGWRLARESVSGLMDAADSDTLVRIVEVLEREREPDWIDVHGLRTWRAGASVHIDMHLQVPRYLSAERLHEIHEAIETHLAPVIAAGGDLVVHFDPCRAHACPRCDKPDCPVRESPLLRRPPITVERATRLDPEVDHGPGLEHPAPAGHAGPTAP